MKINKINESQLEPMVMILVGISCLLTTLGTSTFYALFHIKIQGYRAKLEIHLEGCSQATLHSKFKL